MAAEAKVTVTGQHFVANISIEQVSNVKTEPAIRSLTEAPTKRKVDELSKIIVKADDLPTLIEKVVKHLGIIAE